MLSHSAIALAAVITLFSVGCQSGVLMPQNRDASLKVFNYQGPLLIKDDRTGEVIKGDSEDNTIPVVNTSLPSSEADGEACWKLIVEQSTITFALQNKVLDELLDEMKDLSMDDNLRKAVIKLANGMKRGLRDAQDALRMESPDEYFDALFDTSENIVQFSSLIRDPKLDEKVFLVLVKAVSRLGRNNSGLIQEFIDNCSAVDRSQPRPRGF